MITLIFILGFFVGYLAAQPIIIINLKKYERWKKKLKSILHQ